MAELNVRKRGDKWEYRFEAAKTDGKRNQISKGGFVTKKEAVVYGTKALSEYNRAGQVFSPSDISVADYLDYWMREYCIINLKYSTTEAYRIIIKNHIKPTIGGYRLSTITPTVIQDCINKIYVNKSYTQSYMKNILKVLKGSFAYAVVPCMFIESSPAAYVSLPKYDMPEKTKMIILSPSEINQILDRFKDTMYHYVALMIGYYTGLRISEVYGLTWNNINFSNKTITVDKIVVKMNQNKLPKRGGVRGKAVTQWYLGTCKTPTSYRTIGIGDSLLKLLDEYKKWQEANKLEYREYYTNQFLKEEIAPNGKTIIRILPIRSDISTVLESANLVMVKDNGEFQGTDAMKYPSKIIHYEMGMDFNFHSLRHTHATRLIEAGAHIKTVSERLGHSNTTVTLNTYVHNTNKMQEDAVNLFESVASLSTIENKGGQDADIPTFRVV